MSSRHRGVNVHQKKFLNGEIPMCIPDTEKLAIRITKRYRVYSAFRKKFLEVYSEELNRGSRLVVKRRPGYDEVFKMIPTGVLGPTGVSSYVVKNGLTLLECLDLIREKKSESLRDSLIWRLFYYQAEYSDLYDKTLWENTLDYDLQKKFFAAKTGYEYLDTHIAALKATGKMSNRVRMVCASFFCKNMLQPWYDGAKFFSKYLEDYDAVLNDCNWIWCSQLRFDNQQFVRFFSLGQRDEYWITSCARYREWRARLRLL